MAARHFYIDGATPVPVPPPASAEVFDFAAKRWIDSRPLPELKAVKREEIKRARTEAEQGGFTWDGTVFDSDTVSQGRISGAVQLAMIANSMGAPYSVNWTVADDSVRTLNGTEMVAVGLALGQHVQTQFARGQALQAQINAATTANELNSISF